MTIPLIRRRRPRDAAGPADPRYARWMPEPLPRMRWY
jgi:hypothetical protein